MPKPFKRFKKAAKAVGEALEPSPFVVKGEKVVCPICGGDEFLSSPGSILQRPLFLSFTAPWVKIDRESTTLFCTHCVHLLHFGRPPERAQFSPKNDPDQSTSEKKK
ncbi:MAG: hypothetical protein HKO65_08520 [Gemmatimonadetes bacterium]|nr:hypothetical protein [Gemmatimonadota bacterium]